MNTSTECLYNVYFRTGMVRLSESSVPVEAWNDYGVAVDHSEWCDCRKSNVDENGALIDPFLNAYGDSEPPF